MKKIDLFAFALNNFLRRKARSALTVFGVIIGTAAVVIMLSIGIGMNKGIEDQFSAMGDLKIINVSTKTGTWNEETGEWEQASVVEPLDDISLANMRALDHVEAVSPDQWINNISVLVRNKEQKVIYPSFKGIDAAAMDDLGYEVVLGRLLDERDVGTYNFVVCYNIPFTFNDIHETDWSKLTMSYESKAGEELPMNPVNEFDDSVVYEMTWDSNYGAGAVDTTKPKVKAYEGKCVGVLVQNLNDGKTDWSSEIYMDIKGAMELDELLRKNNEDYNKGMYGDDYYGYSYEDNTNYADGRKNLYNQVKVVADDTSHVLEIHDQLNEMQFQTSSQMDYIRQQQEQTAFLRGILGAIGAVAFFVAAISIANTMVMSIYERTREIGIMKVIGCKLADIRGMFLVEAAIIGIVGGLLGVILSYGISFALNYMAKSGSMAESFGIYDSGASISIIPFWLDIAAVLLATGVGVVSGLYPAIRATRLSALEAIKNE